MHLDDLRHRAQHLHYVPVHGRCGGIVAVAGVDSYGEHYPVPVHKVFLEVAREVVDAVRAHGVVHLDVYRAYPVSRAVVVYHEVEHSEHVAVGKDVPAYLFRQFVVAALSEQAVERGEHHDYAGPDYDERDAEAQGAVEPEQPGAEPDVEQGAQQRGPGDHGIETGVGSGVFQRFRFGLSPHPQVEGGEYQLDRDGGGEYGQPDRAVACLGGLRELPGRFHKRRYAGSCDHKGYGYGGYVFYPPVAERVLLVGRLSRQFRPNEGKHGRESVRKVVHGVEYYGYGAGQCAHGGLRAAEREIGRNAYPARPDYLVVSAVVFSAHFLMPVWP